MEFDNISDAYAVVECYESGGASQRVYLKACAFALKHFEKKYGKDSFWFRELFGHMQGDDWESTFEVRALLHAEVIGCPHDNCGKYKVISSLKKCQHCSYIEGVKREWEEKLNVV